MIIHSVIISKALQACAEAVWDSSLTPKGPAFVLITICPIWNKLSSSTSTKLSNQSLTELPACSEACYHVKAVSPVLDRYTNTGNSRMGSRSTAWVLSILIFSPLCQIRYCQALIIRQVISSSCFNPSNSSKVSNWFRNTFLKHHSVTKASILVN